MAIQSGTYRWNGEKIKQAIEEGALRGLKMAAEHLLKEARDLVPIDTAALERSGMAVVDVDKMEATVLFDTPYAVRQHEDMTYRHAPGRQAKYLEQPMITERDTMRKIIQKQIAKELQSRVDSAKT